MCTRRETGFWNGENPESTGISTDSLFLAVGGRDDPPSVQSQLLILVFHYSEDRSMVWECWNKDLETYLHAYKENIVEKVLTAIWNLCLHSAMLTCLCYMSLSNKHAPKARLLPEVARSVWTIWDSFLYLSAPEVNLVSIWLNKWVQSSFFLCMLWSETVLNIIRSPTTLYSFLSC